jgi:hypothetical protein
MLPYYCSFIQLRLMSKSSDEILLLHLQQMQKIVIFFKKVMIILKT